MAGFVNKSPSFAAHLELSDISREILPQPLHNPSCEACLPLIFLVRKVHVDSCYESLKTGAFVGKQITTYQGPS